eukprot:278038-Amorphochlora_amoeboformis.AAC.1
MAIAFLEQGNSQVEEKKGQKAKILVSRGKGFQAQGLKSPPQEEKAQEKKREGYCPRTLVCRSACIHSHISRKPLRSASLDCRVSSVRRPNNSINQAYPRLRGPPTRNRRRRKKSRPVGDSLCERVVVPLMKKGQYAVAENIASSSRERRSDDVRAVDASLQTSGSRQ